VDAHLGWIQGETLAVEIIGAAAASAGEPSISIERV
jgi:hypothetical protein